MMSMLFFSNMEPMSQATNTAEAELVISAGRSLAPSSPDLNPLDYSVWAFVQAKALESLHTKVVVFESSITKP